MNTQHIEPDSVINAKILTDTIESDSILDGTIKSIDIGLETIESNKIMNGSIHSDDISSSGINFDKLSISTTNLFSIGIVPLINDEVDSMIENGIGDIHGWQHCVQCISHVCG